MPFIEPLLLLRNVPYATLTPITHLDVVKKTKISSNVRKGTSIFLPSNSISRHCSNTKILLVLNAELNAERNAELNAELPS
jgi:hypothetical protein